MLNLQSIVFGLVYLFLEPNPDDPLNKEAAQVMKQDRTQFEKVRALEPECSVANRCRT